MNGDVYVILPAFALIALINSAVVWMRTKSNNGKDIEAIKENQRDNKELLQKLTENMIKQTVILEHIERNTSKSNPE